MICAHRALQVFEGGLQCRARLVPPVLGLKGSPQGQVRPATDAGKGPRLRRLLEHLDRAARVGDPLVRGLKQYLNIRSPNEHHWQEIGASSTGLQRSFEQVDGLVDKGQRLLKL